MKILMRWSRWLHKWVGIYVALLTLVWLVEMPLLPSLYPSLQDVSPTIPPPQAAAPAPVLSLGEMLDRVALGEFGAPPTDMTITYDPARRTYTIRDTKRYTLLTLDADTGAMIGSTQDTDVLFAEQSALRWVHPLLGAVVKAPFEISFILLSATGVYLVWPRRRKKSQGRGVFSLAPGDEFRFMGTRNAADMPRLAAMGLLPGVRTEVVMAPAKGPLVLCARNTRIAVARDVAAPFIIKELGA